MLSLITIDRKPSPGSYDNNKSDFKQRNKGPSFGVSYASFEKVYMKSNRVPNDKNIPGPGSYRIPSEKGKQFSMGQKLSETSTFNKATRNNLPGPGAYSTIETINPKGRTFLSTMK